MKKWLSPSSLIVLALTGGEPGSAEPDRNVSEGPGSGPADGDGDALDIIDSSDCDPVPLRSDCDIDPDECNLIHNITACDYTT